MVTQQISDIKALLDQIEIRVQHSATTPEASVQISAPEFSGDVDNAIGEMVDYLLPLTTPYEFSFYLYIARHSIFKNGGNLARVSIRGMQSGVIKSSRSDTVSRTHIAKALSGLEDVGALRKEADPNKEGTLYRVFLPHEIGGCLKLKESKASEMGVFVATEQEADYYNVKENRLKIFERDALKCRYCQKQLTLLTATLDHIVAAVEGGDNSEANLVTCCLPCNSRKNRKAVGDFLVESGG
jgi:hypothetical protein